MIILRGILFKPLKKTLFKCLEGSNVTGCCEEGFRRGSWGERRRAILARTTGLVGFQWETGVHQGSTAGGSSLTFIRD